MAVVFSKKSSRPKIFFASSSESKTLLEELTLQIVSDDWALPVPWTQAFDPGQPFLESLDQQKTEVDFAVILYTPDDEIRSRGVFQSSPRDNILFELGFFIAALGPERTIVVCPKDDVPKFPSDYSGYKVLSYDPSEGVPREYLWRVAKEVRGRFQEISTRPTDKDGGQRTETGESVPLKIESWRSKGEFFTIYRDAAAELDWFTEFEKSMGQAIPSFNSRMLYFGPGLAKHWNRISRMGKAYEENFEAFQKQLTGLFRFVKAEGINLIDLGVGNFDKGKLILDYFLKLKKIINYFPYDVSYEMLALALQIGEIVEVNSREDVLRKVQNTGSIVAINALFAHLYRYKHLFSPPSSSIFLLLGNTLGNEADEVQTLRDIGRAMNADDVMIAEMQLAEANPRSEAEITEAIQSDAYFYVGPFTALGSFGVSDLELFVRRDHQDEERRDSVTYKFFCHPKKWRQVEHPAYRTSITIPEVDIVVYIVRLYREATLTRLFEKAGFEVTAVTSTSTDQSRRFCYVTARKET